MLIALVNFKPFRVFAPQFFGLTCVTSTLCLDQPDRLTEAKALVASAQDHVAARLGPLNTQPQYLFCSTADCFRRFGNPHVAALYFWGTGVIAINHIGWHPYIVTHETIHHWQAETFGAVAGRRMPQWYIEGMSYVLSDDPRPVIPHPKPEAQREQFMKWLDAGHDWRVPPE